MALVNQGPWQCISQTLLKYIRAQQLRIFIHLTTFIPFSIRRPRIRFQNWALIDQKVSSTQLEKQTFFQTPSQFFTYKICDLVNQTLSPAYGFCIGNALQNSSSGRHVIVTLKDLLAYITVLIFCCTCHSFSKFLVVITVVKPIFAHICCLLHVIASASFL